MSGGRAVRVRKEAEQYAAALKLADLGVGQSVI